MAATQQYILLPREGFRSRPGPAADMLRSVPRASSTGRARTFSLQAVGLEHARVIDTVNEIGPKLIEADDEEAERMNRSSAPLRAVPVVTYDRPNPILHATAAAPAAGATVTVTCEDASTGAPLAGCTVVAFTGFAARAGDQGETDASGQVQLQLSGSVVDRLYVYAPAGYWGAYRSTLPVAPSLTIPVEPVILSFQDAVRHYYGASRFVKSRGVVVGVIDTGVGPHGDLNLVSGRNTVTGEPANAFDDPDGHGTHVAGLIGANGSPPTGLRGVAPDVDLRAYRVFPGGGGGATNYAILKAMIFAADEGCDIVNLSLGGGPFDAIVEEAVRDARDQGILVVVAAGNDYRRRVSYPAAYADATAVSAMGREGTFPPGSLFESDVQRPPHSAADAMECVAAFSNVGPEIDVTGPGVGVLSTLPHDQFGPMSGTSMAAPVVAGCTASLLSQAPSVFGAARDRARSDSIEKLLQTSCVQRGFGPTFEGYGLPDPGLV